MLDQRIDVVASIPQRRNHQVDDVQPVIQVLAKRAGRNPVEQHAIGRGDHPHIDRPRPPVRTDAMNVAVLEEAKQQRLHAQAHLPHFVHENRAAMRLLEQARLVPIRAREAPPHVPEQFRLEQRVGDARAIDRHKRPRVAHAVAVDQSRHHFLSDPALAG